MQKIKVNYIFRKRSEGHNSIEELFQSVIANLPETIDAHIVELPYAGASLKSIFLNLWHVLFIKGVIHVTGDVYYIGLIPFKKTILTIHDVNFLKGSYLKRVLLKWLWLLLPAMITKKITVVSEFTKSELLKLASFSEPKIKVIHNPVNQMLETKLKDFSFQPLILHIGTKKNKNLINTIKALNGIDCKLMIVGVLKKAQKEALVKNEINYENFENLSFMDIKSLYESSDIVSVISFYEGFGMPVIEAQKVGRVVITSNRASIPEVAGSGALVVEPTDVKVMKSGFQTLIKSRETRQDLIEEGLNNVKRFSLIAIVESYVNLYQEL